MKMFPGILHIGKDQTWVQQGRQAGMQAGGSRADRK